MKQTIVRKCDTNCSQRHCCKIRLTAIVTGQPPRVTMLINLLQQASAAFSNIHNNITRVHSSTSRFSTDTFYWLRDSHAPIQSAEMAKTQASKYHNVYLVFILCIHFLHFFKYFSYWIEHRSWGGSGINSNINSNITNFKT